MEQIKVLALCGSLRKDSFNKKLLLYTCDILKTLSCDVTFLDLKPLALPIYDGDLEVASGIPEGGQRLISEIKSSTALLISSPEYNGSFSGALKNAIDWATRAEKNPFSEKIIMLIGTSPGHFGATKSLLHLRAVLSHIGATVIPAQATIPYATKSLDSSGVPTDPAHQNQIKSACQQLVKFATRLKED